MRDGETKPGAHGLRGLERLEEQTQALLVEALTLIQTGKANILPVVLVDEPGGTYWQTFLDFLKNHLLHHTLVSANDLSLMRV
ncbi:MAG: LOG family protein, partial [Vicinamibacterales bacterium]